MFRYLYPRTNSKGGGGFVNGPEYSPYAEQLLRQAIHETRFVDPDYPQSDNRLTAICKLLRERHGEEFGIRKDEALKRKLKRIISSQNWQQVANVRVCRRREQQNRHSSRVQQKKKVMKKRTNNKRAN